MNCSNISTFVLDDLEWRPWKSISVVSSIFRNNICDSYLFRFVLFRSCRKHSIKINFCICEWLLLLVSVTRQQQREYDLFEYLFSFIDDVKGSPSEDVSLVSAITSNKLRDHCLFRFVVCLVRVENIQSKFIVILINGFHC